MREYFRKLGTLVMVLCLHLIVDLAAFVIRVLVCPFMILTYALNPTEDIAEKIRDIYE